MSAAAVQLAVVALAALVSQTEAQWVANLTQPSGVLKSFGYSSGAPYAPNTKKRWTITTPSKPGDAKFLELDVIGLDIEGYASTTCASSHGYDWLLVAPASLLPSFGPICSYRNAQKAGVLAVWCNGRAALPASLFTNAQSLVVEFCTDGLIQGKGFEFAWSTVGPQPTSTSGPPPPPTLPPVPPKSCPFNNKAIVLSPGQSVNVTSPGFPNAYQNNINCSWTITTTNPTMNWKTNFFDLEGYTSACVFDFLQLTHTEDTGKTYSVKYCHLGPYQFIHHTQQLLLNFVTNQDIAHFGFSLTVSAPLPTTPAPTLPPMGTPNNTDFDLYQLSYSGDLYSPFWPNPYTNKLTYQYKINNVLYSQGYDVQLSFVSFVTEEDYDQLTAYTLEGYRYTLDGNLTGRTKTLESNAVTLVFRSDSSIVRPGFHIKISPVKRPFRCALGQFKCETAEVCVPGPKRCDGAKDCADGSDETDSFCQMPSVCGTQSVQPNIVTEEVLPDFLVNGTVSKPGTWPWTLSVHLHDPLHPDFQTCGGTLVAPHWVVTAAHCVVDDTEPMDYFVKIGSWQDHIPNYPYEWDSNISAVFYNPKFNHATYTHDIALFRLASPVPFPFNKHINAACLPSPGAPLPPPGTHCVISGWGTTEGTGSDTVMRQAVTQIYDTGLCNSTGHYPGKIDDTMVCAGYEQGGIDTCQGDSGGPLVCRNAAGKWELTGITSWGKGCALPHLPGVYSRVSALIGWARDIINQRD